MRLANKIPDPAATGKSIKRMQPMPSKVGQIATAAENAVDEHPNLKEVQPASLTGSRLRCDRLARRPFWMNMANWTACLLASV